MSVNAPIAILGGGIMGCSLALSLSMRGQSSILIEAAPSLLQGASRWNEGKIHLGYLYAASGNLATARAVLDGGLTFQSLIENYLETSIAAAIAPGADTYLLHRDSVISTHEAVEYIDQMERLCASYDRGPAHRMPDSEIDELADLNLIRAGWRVPEYSIDTIALADAISARVLTDPRVTLRLNTRVSAVVPDTSGDGYHIQFDDGQSLRAATVCNALWSHRPMIDQTCLGSTDPSPHHRYRVSAFLEGVNTVEIPSMVVAFGPFGDVKNYGNGRFYASWYPAGLLAQSETIPPPEIGSLDAAKRTAIAHGIKEGLGGVLRGVSDIFEAAEAIRIEGGWVYAQGRGSIDQRGASIHARDRWGVMSRNGYISIDTGKYSTAPWIAEHIAENLIG